MSERPRKKKIQIKLVPANEWSEKSDGQRRLDRESIKPIKAATSGSNPNATDSTIEPKIIGEIDPIAIDDAEASSELTSELNDNLDTSRAEFGKLLQQAKRTSTAAWADLAAARRDALIKLYVAYNVTTNTAADAANSEIGKSVISRLIVECVIQAARILS